MQGDVLALGAVGLLALAGARRRGSRSLEESRLTMQGLLRLRDVLAALRALHWSHWTTHWMVSGASFYGDHLLFERLYTDPLTEEIDGTAERIVGYANPQWAKLHLDAGSVMEASAKWIKRWSKESCPIKRALLAERDTQEAIAAAYQHLKGSDQITLGLDDWLMGLASAHDTNIYLLQQREGTCGCPAHRYTS